MSGFDYGNARLRAMKSRLLSRAEVEALAGANSLQTLFSTLARTAYRRPIEAALVRKQGMACLTEALSRDLMETLGRMRTFYSGPAGELVAVILYAYDVHNLKTILRGLEKHASPEEMATAQLPVGELAAGLLAQLARAPEPRAVIDQTASMGLPIAQPLLELRAKRPGAGLLEMELALDRWRFQQAQAQVRRYRRGAEWLSAAVSLEADLVNVCTTMRFVHTPAERQALRKWVGSDDLDGLFVGPGRLPFELLSQAGRQDTMEAAVKILARAPYEPPLRAGLGAYMRSGRLGDFEGHLRGFRLRWTARLIATDPLGIGVPLGYSALKVNEVANLRWVAQGINLGLDADAIKAELEFVQ